MSLIFSSYFLKNIIKYPDFEAQRSIVEIPMLVNLPVNYKVDNVL